MQNSSLTTPDSQPFHLKLVVADASNEHPEFNTEIEIWRCAPDKWPSVFAFDFQFSTFNLFPLATRHSFTLRGAQGPLACPERSRGATHPKGAA